MNGPKNTKYRKVFGPLVDLTLEELKYINPLFGVYYFKFVQSGVVPSTEIDSARKTLKKYLKKRGCIWTAVFPAVSISSKPTEVRMGKGKGAHSFWAANVKAGRVLFEIAGVTEKEVKEAFYLVKQKVSLQMEMGKLKE
jgi:large subunit ribosomal protein L16